MIVFINGSIHAGKSTIAKLLSEKLPRCANIEIDELRNFISSTPLEESIPLNLQNTISLIKNFVAQDFNVVVPYPLSQKNYEYVSEQLNGIDTEIFFITLAPNIEKALTDSDNRTLDDWERERIKHHYKKGIPSPNFGTIIDSTDDTPAETLKKVLSVIEK